MFFGSFGVAVIAARCRDKMKDKKQEKRQLEHRSKHV
jgi:hypothetical protein